MKHEIAVAEATMSFFVGLCFASETLFQVSSHARLCDANIKSILITILHYGIVVLNLRSGYCARNRAKLSLH